MAGQPLPPINGYFFEDLEIGQRFASRRVTVTEDAIIRFALEWDPHAFHIDREEANESMFGGLIGSGLQTLLLTSRMLYDSGLFQGTALAGLGVGELRFLKPLLPGDTIGAVTEIVDKSVSRNPTRGKVRIRIQTLNQRGDLILSHTREMLLARRS
ncbi:MaoC family dehydratase [Mesorhizobium sp. L-8-10]|uniref:MaoC/PaaZ C-terminal domain-containing protein n=1 Tax=Mesorhizobium sp. L-8-10 TaxID=2744523 RepID=UPI001927B072|nr:MaoC/PaaZ C-terminal domain-containing protein [Mesorhizobium sp. L-8-10]BCH29780.1 MaoC family dehydratase [Mesorhizobium sp. L-8-10]